MLGDRHGGVPEPEPPCHVQLLSHPQTLGIPCYTSEIKKLRVR